MIEKFFTTEQVANILQVHPFTILKFIRSGKLKGIKLGRVYRMKESDVKEFLESRLGGGKAEKIALESTQVPSKVPKPPDHSDHPSIPPEKKVDTPTYDLPAKDKNKNHEEPEKDHYYII